jgi:hypothetical protein
MWSNKTLFTKQAAGQKDLDLATGLRMLKKYIYFYEFV